MPSRPRATSVAMALVGTMLTAPAAQAAVAHPLVRPERVRVQVRAGAWVTVGARVAGVGGALPGQCRLLVAGRRGALGAPRTVRRIDPQGRVAWRWRMPVRTQPTRRWATVRCGSATTRTLLTVLRPLFTARAGRPELVERPVTSAPDERAYAYLVRLRNPRRDFDLVGVSARIDLLDDSGRTVTSASPLLERLPAGREVLVGDQVQVLGARQPVTVRVRVDAAEGITPPRPAAVVRGLSLVRTSDGSELHVSGTVANPSFTATRPGDLTLALRDARGQLVDVGVSLTSEALAAGGSLSFDEGFFGAGYLSVASVEGTLDAGR